MVTLQIKVMIISTTYNVRIIGECADISWIGQQLKKMADALHDRYDSVCSLENIGRQLRFIGDSLNVRSSAIVVGILGAAELYLQLP